MKYFSSIVFSILVVASTAYSQEKLLNSVHYKKAISSLASNKHSSTLLQYKLVAYIFLSPECPLSAYYIPLLNELHTDIKEAVIVGIVPGKSYSKQEVLNFVDKEKIKFPVYIDNKKKLVAILDAAINPEAIVVNKGKHIVYKGAIDDKVEKLGEKKVLSKHAYLKNALTETSNNRTITITETKAVGCYINDI